MSLTVLINGARVDHSSLSCSSVRRGGFEACNFQIPRGIPPTKGSEIAVFDGCSWVWHGYVEEAGQTHDQGVRGANVVGVGYGGALKRNPYSMIYIDRDLSRWRNTSVSRLLNLIAGGFRNQGTWQVQPNDSGIPVIQTALQAPWPANAIISIHYDAGAGNSIASLRGVTSNALGVNFADVTWNIHANLATADNLVTGQVSTDVRAAGSGGGWQVNGGSGYRYAEINQLYAAAFTGDNLEYQLHWSTLRVFGNHGLRYANGPGNGDDGCYAVDVIKDAIHRSDAGFTLEVADDPYIVEQLAYYEPVQPEQVVDQMAKLLGWNYGTWEPGLFSSQPVFKAGPPPSVPTCQVSYIDCHDVDINDKLSEMYDRAIVLSSDVAGTTERTDIEAPHPGLPEGIHNTTTFNLGVTTTAATQGAFLLSLLQEQARAAGQIGQLPPLVRYGSGQKPAHLLRPGLDRITVIGLPNSGNLVADSNAARQDTFLISRLSLTEAEDGTVSTTVEVDSGSDLTETLNARLDIDRVLAGV